MNPYMKPIIRIISFSLLVFIIVMILNNRLYVKMDELGGIYHEPIIEAPNGEKYVFIGGEGIIIFHGKKKFHGWLKGDPLWYNDLFHRIYTGIFYIEGDDENNFLVRIAPQHFSFMYYRKASLPEAIPENFIRPEYFDSFPQDNELNQHVSCDEGIKAPDVQTFFEDAKNEKTRWESGYEYNNEAYSGYVIGYFEDSTSLVRVFNIYKYGENEFFIEYPIAYMGDNKEFYIPQKWVDALNIR